MRLLTLQDELEAYLAEPSSKGFAQVRSLLIADVGYAPNQATIEDLTMLWRQGDFESLLDFADQLLPAWALCGRVHGLCEQAAIAIGDGENAEICAFLSDSCLRGLLASGDGTVDRPYLVTYPSDQNDVLAAINQDASSRHLVQTAGKWLECVTSSSHRKIWFDVDALLRAQTRADEEMPVKKAASRVV